MYYYVFLSIYLAILLLILERGFSWAEVVSGTHVADRLFAKQLLSNVCAVTDEHGVVVFESQLFSDGINATVLWLGIYRLGLKSLLSEQYHLSLSLPGE